MHKILLVLLFTLSLMVGTNISQANPQVGFYYTEYNKDIDFVTTSYEKVVKCFSILGVLTSEIDVALHLTKETDVNKKMQQLRDIIDKEKKEHTKILVQTRVAWALMHDIDEKSAYQNEVNKARRHFGDIQMQKWVTSGSEFFNQVMEIRTLCTKDLKENITPKFNEFLSRIQKDLEKKENGN